MNVCFIIFNLASLQILKHSLNHNIPEDEKDYGFLIYLDLALIAQLIKNLPAMQETSDSWVGNIYWRRDRLPIPVFLGFPCGSADKESVCKAGDLGLIPELGRSPGEGKRCPLSYPGLENSMDTIESMGS